MVHAVLPYLYRGPRYRYRCCVGIERRTFLAASNLFAYLHDLVITTGPWCSVYHAASLPPTGEPVGCHSELSLTGCKPTIVPPYDKARSPTDNAAAKRGENMRQSPLNGAEATLCIPKRCPLPPYIVLHIHNAWVRKPGSGVLRCPVARHLRRLRRLRQLAGWGIGCHEAVCKCVNAFLFSIIIYL